MKKHENTSEAAALRQKAEELLKKKASGIALQFSEANMIKLIHELEVHQIELEMMNDELVLAKELQLKKANDKYVELYDFAPLGYFTLSNEGNVMELNLAGASMLGKERSLLRNSRFGFFVSEITKPNFNHFLEKVFSSKAKETAEVILKNNGNLPMHIHLTAMAVENTDQCLVTAVDITGIKQAEQELINANKELAIQNAEKVKQAAELILANKEIAIQTALSLANAEKAEVAELHKQALDRLHKIASMVPGVVYQYRLRPDGTSCFPYASEAIKQIYRVSPDEVREDASKVFANLHPDDLVDVAASIQASAKDLTPWQHEYRVKFSDGTIRSLYGNALPQLEADRSVLWHGFITDVSERNQSAEALKESEKKFRTVADYTYDWEYWTGVDGRIIYMSPSCERISGYKPEEFLFDRFLLKKIVHPGDANLFEDHSENINSLQQRHEISEFDFRILKKDGSVVHIGHLCRPVIDVMGNYEGRRISNRDITLRKQIEEELKLASARLFLATRAGGIGTWDYDIVNNILVWDDRMYELYDIEKNDFAGMHDSWKTSIHPDDLERSINESKKALCGEKEYDTEFRVVWRDSSIHNIRALALVQRDESGKAMRMIGTNWDITELRKAEKEKLEDSESKYRSIFQGSPDGILIADEQTKMIIYANSSQCRLFGHTEDELKTMTIAGIHPKDAFPDILAEFERISQGEKILAENIQCLRKNGEIFYADIASSFITINGRKCSVGFFRDITNRKRTEDELKNNAALLTNLIINLHEGVLLEGSSRKILLTNQLFCDMFGIPAPPEALLGADCSNAAEESKMFFKDPDKFIADIRVILARKKAALNDELELVDGRFFERDYIPTFLNNEYSGHLWKYRDITQRRKAEVLLQEALIKAEASNRLKTAFMNNISHEVRTPLNGIMGFGNLLTDPSLTTEERQQYNQFLKASGNRLISTITDYMDISLIASGNLEVSLKPVNVSDVLKDLQIKFQDSCGVKNIVLNLSIPREQEHLMLITDSALLRKIISCLLDNAIKFTSLGSISFGYSVKSNSIEFFVIDTGIGIAPEARERIFEPFMQENITDTRGHEGSGLGLSIIRGFLKLLDSEIRLESAKGQGASFFFSLPMAQGTTEENEPIDIQIGHTEIIRPVILIAEDDLNSDFYMEILLKSVASIVFKAANGKEAVEMCRLHPDISLVLMDLMMPVMDGLESTRQIKALRKDLPVIAVTAYALGGDKKKALDAGCADFLSKPVSKTDLLEKLKKYGLVV